MTQISSHSPSHSPRIHSHRSGHTARPRRTGSAARRRGDHTRLSQEARSGERSHSGRLLRGMRHTYGGGRTRSARGLSRRGRAHGPRRAHEAHGAQRGQRIEAGPNTGRVDRGRLARDAESIARSGRAGRGRNCFRGVKWALARQGVNLSGVPAYTAAGQLARNSNFHEVRGLSRGSLPELPAGAVVVWNRGAGHRNGHVSVALGDGREASDVIRQQITGYSTAYRVFLPN